MIAEMGCIHAAHFFRREIFCREGELQTPIWELRGKESAEMSELRRRLAEWAVLEKEKISGIRGVREKAAYIWEYYKLWIIGLIFLLWFIPFAVYQYTTRIREYWCYMIFSNTYTDVDSGSDLWEDFTEYAGIDTREDYVKFNGESYFDYLKGVTGNSYFEAFVTYADSGILDGIVMGSESLTALGKTGRLLDLNSDACESIREKYGDRFLYAEPFDVEYSEEEVPVCIDISDSKLETEYAVYAEPIALGIGALSENVESVELFLDFILEE